MIARSRLAVRFALLLLAILIISVGSYSAWSNNEQHNASEEKVLAEARLLSQQMSATWDYIDSVQNYINYNSDGSYDFKKIYCSVAGKSIALKFTQSTDRIIRYTREDPRTGNDTPDEFEARALTSFEQGSSEYYGVTEYKGEQVFRYVSAIYIKFGCLSCHGSPAGDLDEIGYPKEGMQVGDLAGAISLIIPMKQFQEEATSRTVSNVALFFALASLIVVSTSIALHRWVTKPLSRLAEATKAVGQGNFDTQINEIQAGGQIADLVHEFSDMEKKLENSYEGLEAVVRERTTELVKANETLESQRDKITQMNSQLVAANKHLQNENEFKSNILAVMSHELRTPVASIIAYVDVWLKSATDKDQTDIGLIREIKRNSDDLLLTITNNLDAASIDAERFTVDISPLDLLDVANATEALVLPLAQEKGIQFAVYIDPEMPLVSSDQNIIHKVVVNLVSNAIKFTEPGGQVTLTVSLDQEEQRISLKVSDTGIGISTNDIASIFERFKQADSSISRKYGGSGLGLSLVKEMAELLGGRITVSSLEGEGSVFEVLLPYEDVMEVQS